MPCTCTECAYARWWCDIAYSGGPLQGQICSHQFFLHLIQLRLHASNDSQLIIPSWPFRLGELCILQILFCPYNKCHPLSARLWDQRQRHSFVLQTCNRTLKRTRFSNSRCRIQEAFCYLRRRGLISLGSLGCSNSVHLPLQARPRLFKRLKLYSDSSQVCCTLRFKMEPFSKKKHQLPALQQI